MSEKAYDAVSGTAWVYRVGHVDEDIFVVLDGYSNPVPAERPGTCFRKYLSLTNGEVGWFANRSHMNDISKAWE